MSKQPPEWLSRLVSLAEEIGNSGHRFLFVSVNHKDHSDNTMLLGSDDEHAVASLAHMALAAVGRGFANHSEDCDQMDVVSVVGRLVYEAAAPGTPAVNNRFLEAVVREVELRSRADRGPDLIPVKQLQ